MYSFFNRFVSIWIVSPGNNSFFSTSQIGDLVYAKLLVANKDMEPELVCIDSAGHSSGMGVIRDGGYVLTTSINLVRK